MPVPRGVTFSVGVGNAGAWKISPVSRCLEGLNAARHLRGFDAVQRDGERLDELLPWAGNV